VNEALNAHRWLISGRVQGVGFRWFVFRRAEELGIAGWARNLPDGRVEVLGISTAEKLAAFDTSLRSGPRLSVVDNVEKSDCPHEVGAFKSFDIR
jgi:acylphosphatase